MNATWRRLAALLVVALGALAATGAPRRGVAWALARASGFAVEVGGVALAWRPLRVVARDVRLRTVRGAPAFARAEALSIPFGALLRQMRELTLERPRLHAVELPDGRVVVGGGHGAGTPHTLRLDRLRLIAGRVTLRGADGVRHVRVPDATLRDAAVVAAPASGRLDLAATLEVAGERARLRARQRTRDASQRLEVALAVRSADGARLRRLVPDLPFTAGRVRGRLRYTRHAGPTPEAHLRGSGTLRTLRLDAGAGSPRAVLRRVSLAGADVDLLRRTVRVERATGRGGMVAPSARAPRAESTAWSGDVGLVSLADVHVHRAGPPFRIRALHARDLSTRAESGRILADLRLATGGGMKARGRLDPARPGLDAAVRLRDVPLPALVPALHVASGRLGGTATVSAPPWRLADGALALDAVRVDGPGAGDEPVLTWEHLGLDVERLDLAPLRLWLRRATLEAPSLALRRDAAGLHPIPEVTSLLAAPGLRALLATPATGTAAGAMPSAPAALDVAVHAGTVRFADQTTEPPFEATIEAIEAHVHEDAGPRPRATDFSLGGRVRGGGSVRATGRLDGPSLRTTLALADIALPPLNPYLSAVAGVVAARGAADVESDIEVRAREAKAPTRVAFADLALEPSGGDPFPELVGLPLGRAVALMRGSDGRVALELPLAGDPRASLAPLLFAAVRDAVSDTITHPLLTGATLAREAGGERLRLAPVAFAADATELDPAARTALERLVTFLHRHPTLVATLRGRSGPPDTAARRGAARAGQTALAAARAAWARDRLCGDLGVAAARVRVADPAPAGSPAVLIDLLGAGAVAPGHGSR